METTNIKIDKQSLPKYWKVAETQIKQASEFLDNPNLFSCKEYTLESYAKVNRKTELTSLMLELEKVAKNNGCKTGFWRRIKKVATQLELPEKVEEYEREFHSSLSKT